MYEIYFFLTADKCVYTCNLRSDLHAYNFRKKKKNEMHLDKSQKSTHKKKVYALISIQIARVLFELIPHTDAHFIRCMRQTQHNYMATQII